MPSKPLLSIGDEFVAVRNKLIRLLQMVNWQPGSYDLLLAALLIEANTHTPFI